MTSQGLAPAHTILFLAVQQPLPCCPPPPPRPPRRQPPPLFSSGCASHTTISFVFRLKNNTRPSTAMSIYASMCASKQAARDTAPAPFPLMDLPDEVVQLISNHVFDDGSTTDKMNLMCTAKKTKLIGDLRARKQSPLSFSTLQVLLNWMQRNRSSSEFGTAKVALAQTCRLVRRGVFLLERKRHERWSRRCVNGGNAALYTNITCPSCDRLGVLACSKINGNTHTVKCQCVSALCLYAFQVVCNEPAVAAVSEFNCSAPVFKVTR